MTPLAAELHRILTDERDHPPLSAGSLAAVLKAIGFDPSPVPAADLEAALCELIAAGQVEWIWRRGAAHYRVIPASAAAVAAAGNRT